jgi:hypothetical protein
VSQCCSYCKGSKLPGIHLPADFDDRKPSQDSKVFVAKCDECNRYVSDADAARVVAKATGWAVRKSLDYFDDLDPKYRREKAATKLGRSYYRPFFAVTIKQAQEVA